MGNSFADLKRGGSSLRDQILAETNKLNSGGYTQDERFWKPTVDQANVGQAEIRFLPPSKNEDEVWVRIFNHGFQGPGGWYIENSLTTLNKPDPVSEYNNKLWNRGDEEGKTLARKQKRNLTFISNILVVKDPGNPANEGKVFLFRYGKAIFNIINEAMAPEFDDVEAINPFDLWAGANFKMRIRDKEGYRNYDKSTFAKPAPISKKDDDMEAIWESQFTLQEFLADANFKSYEDLATRLNRVLGTVNSGTTADSVEAPAPAASDERAAKTAPESDSTKSPEAVKVDDDSIDFFKQLAEED